MKIYFYGPPTSRPKLLVIYDTVKRLLRQAEIEVYTNTEKQMITEEFLSIAEQGGMVLNEMDAFIIEGSTPYHEIGYFLAFALAQKKPTLYLTEKSLEAQKIFKYLMGKEVPKLVQIMSYSEKNIEEKILDYLRSIKAGDIKEIPSIKYTLRITPSIERFLEWKTLNTKLTKADFLREEVERLIKQDEHYQSFLRKRKK